MQTSILQLLRSGSAGEAVADLQVNLNLLPTQLPRLTEDGLFGPKTLARVREFQQSAGLKVDGLVGPVTLGMLSSKVGAQPVGEKKELFATGWKVTAISTTGLMVGFAGASIAGVQLRDPGGVQQLVKGMGMSAGAGVQLPIPAHPTFGGSAVQQFFKQIGIPIGSVTKGVVYRTLKVPGALKLSHLRSGAFVIWDLGVEAGVTGHLYAIAFGMFWIAAPFMILPSVLWSSNALALVAAGGVAAKVPLATATGTVYKPM